MCVYVFVCVCVCALGDVSFLRAGFEGEMWDLCVFIPDYCLFFALENIL